LAFLRNSTFIQLGLVPYTPFVMLVILGGNGAHDEEAQHSTILHIGWL
jgi:hypothetical protein